MTYCFMNALWESSLQLSMTWVSVSWHTKQYKNNTKNNTKTTQNKKQYKKQYKTIETIQKKYKIIETIQNCFCFSQTNKLSCNLPLCSLSYIIIPYDLANCTTMQKIILFEDVMLLNITHYKPSHRRKNVGLILNRTFS